MKNQYVGDVGDFGKYALLRAFVEAGIRVGVNWYLTEDDGSNDGKFTNYLNDENMRNHSPEVFDVLRKLVKKSKKSVIDIQKSGIIKDALFYAKLLKTEGTPVQRTTGLLKAEVDNLIWSFCAEGFGEICTASPCCEQCPIRGRCK